jgi:hypothetical protein
MRRATSRRSLLPSGWVGISQTVLNTCGVRRGGRPFGSPAVIRLLVLLYAWTFPFLRVIHWDAFDHAPLPACNGFAAVHNHYSAADGPLVSSLHIPPDHPPCTVCALARSATLASVTVVGPLPIICPLIETIPDLVPCTEGSPARTPGARAPPVA